uniref:Glycosyltransferase family 92 protein n=1 Tax=Aureoumbra lagunensis TaxID=44058 RepID=A0A7S3JNM2_9STRA
MRYRDELKVEYRREYYARLLGAEFTVQKNFTTLPKVAACVRIRNEARYLKEWLEFHKLVGVSIFYIFDDDSSDTTQNILAPYVKSGEALVWSISDKKCHNQEIVCADRRHDALHGERGFRDECLRTNPKQADWILMTDVDEFAYPTGAYRTFPQHLAQEECSIPAYYLLRWHVFGAAGHLERPLCGSSIEAYQQRGREDDIGCYPHFTCGDDKSPPICAKVLARADCVRHQGTHYVIDTAHSCQNLYFGDRKASQLKNDQYAIYQHEFCAASIHLNHYAVRSRRDFVDKFERGRISSSARDAQLGIADANSRTRSVPTPVIRDFIAGKEKHHSQTNKANAAKSAADLMLLEFFRRDHSQVLDDTILPLATALRQRLNTPTCLDTAWACSFVNTTQNTDLRQAASAWQLPLQHAVYKKKKSLVLFAHIPKTGGTNLNLVLRDAAAIENIKFCQLKFTELEDKKNIQTKSAQNCHMISAETDLSFPYVIRHTKRIAVFTILRDPIARLASQYEHHLAAGRIRTENLHRTHGDIVRLASPRLCSQLERDAVQCSMLAHPRKCRAGGFCTLFQNHQTHILAGAQYFSKSARSASRRSAANLLCAATNSLQALISVGITERLSASLCLLFHKLGYVHVYKRCCNGDTSATCSLFKPRTTEHSAADRGRIFSSTGILTNASSSSSDYLTKYVTDDILLAAMYEGNALDCLIYERAIGILQHELRIDNLMYKIDRTDFDLLMRHCRSGKQAADRLLPPRGTAYVE